ncbi:MAG: glycosyltransferase [Candidatus Levybacteria bacterium]|nr:glycosyltransferase [Candidatus Levybacteria bacterium]
MKVALVYDRLNKWGGAERVLLALHRIFPDAPLYTSVWSKKNAAWANIFDVRTSFLQSASVLRDYNELLGLFMPLVFESFSFDEYDLVISVTSEAAKGIITKPGTTHVCYCLTPTRYLWSGYNDYFSSDLTRFISYGAVSYLRSWDKIAAARPDHFIAISTEVQKRIKKYYQRDSEIIFPPLMLSGRRSVKKSEGDYYLLVSRLSRFSYYKRVDLAIDAFNASRLPLVIVGSGPMENSLRSKANKNIKFVGDLSDKKLSYYYENCKALVFPGVEDFGLVMAEAAYFGAPVIAYKGGGALDIVKEGITGEFFTKQTPEDLVETLKRSDKKRYNKADIIRSTKRFSYENFKSDLEKFIKNKAKI